MDVPTGGKKVVDQQFARRGNHSQTRIPGDQVGPASFIQAQRKRPAGKMVRRANARVPVQKMNRSGDSSGDSFCTGGGQGVRRGQRDLSYRRIGGQALVSIDKVR